MESIHHVAPESFASLALALPICRIHKQIPRLFSAPVSVGVSHDLARHIFRSC